MRLLGHDFKDRSLLQAALTHSSLTRGRHQNHAQQDYERLEFVGDRVLGLVISEELFRRFPQADAGNLSRRYNAQVRRETLAEICAEIGIDKFVFMASDLAAAGGGENPAILEDVMEAIIAAIYLDGGYDAAREFIKSKWWQRLDKEGASKKDAKSSLQEWAAKAGKPPPVYTVVEETGPDHAPRFKVDVRLKGLDPFEGMGTSKRSAEQQAAEKMLKDLQSE
ncbi:ribonuclease III [Sneathiella marina]|uniref:Ribonuclease 3 n=1 Tax=Sneathiella marina TaxID=2950108 RepID=A0ABY4VY14_9PROT|nr:ribonuclease III [Sneathiella marina]USG59810.1 ribonuclease III [Sneathiella marina]